MTDTSYITCKNVSFSYDGKTAVSDISFNLNKGDYLCILGENGTGKSTIIKGLLGLIKPASGEVIYSDVKHTEIGYLPQIAEIPKDFPASVYEAVLSGRCEKLGKSPFFSSKDRRVAKKNMRLLGIEKLNRYFTMFGFGEPTGIELYETKGTVDSPELRTSLGELWTPGLTIQAGIGHGKNMFTPIQLCSYVSTIANKGVRYKAHLVKSVKTADLSKTIVETQKQVLSKANFKAENWRQVYEGMYMVATESYLDFTKVPVKVGVKTGTTTVEKTINGGVYELNNGFIIGFAPFEDPEIAVAVAIEYAGMSAYLAPVLAEIMAYYFTEKNVAETNKTENTLLS